MRPPPDNFPSWNDYWRHVGVPDDELPTDTDASDSIVDPKGVGPRVWFQVVPEAKSVKNRVHLDLKVGGGRHQSPKKRRSRIDKAVERLTAAGARAQLEVEEDGNLDHVIMTDPEGNEFCVV